MRVPDHTDRFGLGIVLILATIVCFAFAGSSRWGGLLAVVVESATLIVLLGASAVARSTLRVVSGVLVVAVLAVLAGAIADNGSQWLKPAIASVIAVIAPYFVMRRLFSRTTIDSAMVYGALCVYLLAGIFFASVFAVVDGATTAPFFAQIEQARGVDFGYFSFVTLATLGYGDLTPRGDLGRMLAVTETLLGQLYLVGTVAMLVSNLGKTRQLGRKERPDV